MLDPLLIVGLPSHNLQNLSEELAINIFNVLEDPESLDPPGCWVSCDIPAQQNDSLVKDSFLALAEQAQDEESKFLMFYQAPWDFLSRQINSGNSSLGESEDIYSDIMNMMAFWREYQQSMLNFFRANNERSLLLNGDRVNDMSGLIAYVEERFGIAIAPKVRESTRQQCRENDNQCDVCLHIIDTLTPECLDLYLDLESSADLLGRDPEFALSGGAFRKEYALEFLQQNARIAHFGYILGQIGDQSEPVEVKLKSLVDSFSRNAQLVEDGKARIESLKREKNTLKEERDRLAASVAEGEKILGAEALRLNEAQEEAELLLLQLHQVQEELETTFMRMHKIEGMFASGATLSGSLEEKLQQLLDVHGRNSQGVEDSRAKMTTLEREKNTLKEERDRLAASVVEGEKRLGAEAQGQKASQEEAELLLLQLHQVQEELEYYFELTQKQEQEIGELKARPEAASFRLFKNTTQKKEKAESSLEEQVGLLQKASNFIQEIKKQRVVKSQMRTIRSSGLFDEQWYLQRYPDVGREGMDPIEHYVRHGFSEGRDPSSNFHTEWYQHEYPDVGRENLNPLVHYIQDGKSEGRQPMRFMG